MASINCRRSGWPNMARLSPSMFAIPQRRYDDLTKRMEDLLEPVDQE